MLNRALKILVYTNSMTLLAAAMLAPIYAIFVEEVGWDLMDASIAGGIFALVAGITTIIAGRWTDKIKEKKLIIILWYIIMGIGFLLYFWVDSVIFLFIVQSIIWLGEAVYSPAFDALFSKNLDKNKSATQWWAWESTFYFTTAIWAVSGGWLVTLFGFQALFVTMAIMCFGSALYLLFLKQGEI